MIKLLRIANDATDKELISKHLKTPAITMLMPFTYLCLGFTSEIHFSLWAGLLFSVVQSLALEGNFMRVIVATSHGEG